MIYFSGKGDKGSSVIGRKKIKKDSLILESLGELDELNSLIGLTKNYLPKKYFKKLTEIQNVLFIIQSNIAYFLYPHFKPSQLKREYIANLEKEILSIEKKVKISKSFIIPGSEAKSAWFDYLRAVTRRVERRIISFDKKFKLSSEILSYLNRLSSFFYALARLSADKKREIKPWY